MKTKSLLFTMLLLIVGALNGCQTPRAMIPTSGAARSTRNNCCGLLHQLLNKQKDVSLLRFIKREQSDVKELVNKIAINSATGAKLREALAKDDPRLNLDDIRLPPGEVATRAAIAATKKKELLDQTGDKFELTLLLTQTQALCYAWHLAKVAGENESQPDHARALAGLSEDMRKLYYEAFALLLSKTK